MIRPTRTRLVSGCLAAALAVTGLLRLPPVPARVLEARGLAAWQAGRHAEATDRLSEAAEVSGDGARWTQLGLLAARHGEAGPARQALVRGSLAGEPEVRARAWHALSALHLESGRTPEPGPGTTPRPERSRIRTEGPDPRRASAAARAAVEALRLRPGDPAVAWNLYLARTAGGFPEPETTSSPLDARAARTLRSALGAVEVRTLRATLGAILNELDARRPPPPIEGPPW